MWRAPDGTLDASRTLSFVLGIWALLVFVAFVLSRAIGRAEAEAATTPEEGAGR